jgi:urea carboxylase-associated protein 1
MGRAKVTDINDLLPQGRILEDTVVPARAPWSARIARGNMLRLIDLEGQQAIDFLCFSAVDPAERYDAANTIKTQGNIFVGEGTILRSSLARPMMTVVMDTCGRHDTIFGCCSFEVDRIRYGKTNAECCRRNFEREMARREIGSEHIVANVNFFMYVPVGGDGGAGIVRPLSQPGDYVDLRAEMDLIAVLSNCPEELNPATGTQGPTPVRAIVWTAD